MPTVGKRRFIDSRGRIITLQKNTPPGYWPGATIQNEDTTPAATVSNAAAEEKTQPISPTNNTQSFFYVPNNPSSDWDLVEKSDGGKKPMAEAKL